MKHLTEKVATALSGLSGPNPPFKVCPSCGTTSVDPWKNPMLEALRELGRYTGDAFGGLVLCGRCDGNNRCQKCFDTGWENIRVASKTGQSIEERVRKCDCGDSGAVVMGLPIRLGDGCAVRFRTCISGVMSGLGKLD